jgi:hypothetical protein
MFHPAVGKVALAGPENLEEREGVGHLLKSGRLVISSATFS